MGLSVYSGVSVLTSCCGLSHNFTLARLALLEVLVPLGTVELHGTNIQMLVSCLGTASQYSHFWSCIPRVGYNVTVGLVLSVINATSDSCSAALPVFKLFSPWPRAHSLLFYLPLGRLHLPDSHPALSFFALITLFLFTSLIFVTQATLY